MSKIQFRNAAHRDFVLENLDKCKVNDCYHRAFFYVMGISEETRMNIGKMFDFKRDCIIPEGMHGGWQTSGTVKVCHLAFKSADGVCVKQDRIIRKPKRELRISRPSVQRSSFKNNRSILSENRASELWSVQRKQLNSLQGRQEIRQSRPYRKVQPILFRGRSRPQNKRQRLLLRPQKKLPL